MTLIETSMQALAEKLTPPVERIIRPIAANQNDIDCWYWNDNA